MKDRSKYRLEDEVGALEVKPGKGRKMGARESRGLKLGAKSKKGRRQE